MGASISRLQRAGGDRNAAVAGLLSDPSPVVAAAKAKYANDPAGLETWINSKINETTKGKYHGVLGKIGKVVEKVAPIAALAIPGLGPVASAAIAAGGTAAGRAAQGKSVNVANTLLTGAGGYAGNKLLHGEGVKALIGGSGAPAGAVPATDAIAGGAKTGLLDRALGWAGKHPLDAAQLTLAGIGTVQGAQRAGQADQLRTRALAGVDPNAPVDLGLPAPDPNNPYGGAQVPYNRSRRAALSSLVN